MPLFQNSGFKKQLQIQDKTRLVAQWKIFKIIFKILPFNVIFVPVKGMVFLLFGLNEKEIVVNN